MRCYFMKKGHITAVETLDGLSDAEAVEKFREMIAARNDKANYDGFEVWDRARVVFQYPPPPPESEDDGSGSSRRRP